MAYIVSISSAWKPLNLKLRVLYRWEHFLQITLRNSGQELHRREEIEKCSRPVQEAKQDRETSSVIQVQGKNHTGEKVYIELSTHRGWHETDLPWHKGIQTKGGKNHCWFCEEIAWRSPRRNCLPTLCVVVSWIWCNRKIQCFFLIKFSFVS